MCAANSLADYWAASCLQEQATAARKGRQRTMARREPPRRRSAEHVRSGSGLDSIDTLEVDLPGLTDCAPLCTERWPADQACTPKLLLSTRELCS